MSMIKLIKYKGAVYQLYRSRSRRAEFRSAVNRLWRDLERVVAYLRERGIDPVVVGGLAVQHHGWERLTEDIDILIAREAYQQLVQEGKIKFGQLKLIPGTQVDVLTEGKDSNPDPEYVRDGSSVYPTFPGLMYLKLKAGRAKDIGDVTELIKAKGLDEVVLQEVLDFLPTPELQQKFRNQWAQAVKEQQHQDEQRVQDE
jgi:hypothetical protein